MNKCVFEENTTSVTKKANKNATKNYYRKNTSKKYKGC